LWIGLEFGDSLDYRDPGVLHDVFGALVTPHISPRNPQHRLNRSLQLRTPLRAHSFIFSYHNPSH
jgi:hypothetical protein